LGKYSASVNFWEKIQCSLELYTYLSKKPSSRAFEIEPPIDVQLLYMTYVLDDRTLNIWTKVELFSFFSALGISPFDS
jgi:hypothetical protein